MSEVAFDGAYMNLTSSTSLLSGSEFKFQALLPHGLSWPVVHRSVSQQEANRLHPRYTPFIGIRTFKHFPRLPRK